MRVILLANRQGNQIALANKIAAKAEVAGIIFSNNIPRKSPGFSKRARLLLSGLANKTVGRELVDVWFELQKKYKLLYPNLPTQKVVNVENVIMTSPPLKQYAN